MGFPSPATDYQENRLSLDQHCNTGAPGVFFFEVIPTLSGKGIKHGALLIVDFGGTPVDGSLVLCVLGTRIQDHAIATTPQAVSPGTR